MCRGGCHCRLRGGVRTIPGQGELDLAEEGGFLNQGKLDLAEGARGVRRSSGQARHLGGGGGGGGGYAIYCLINSLLH